MNLNDFLKSGLNEGVEGPTAEELENAMNYLEEIFEDDDVEFHRINETQFWVWHADRTNGKDIILEIKNVEEVDEDDDSGEF